jgi:hypothetical protein
MCASFCRFFLLAKFLSTRFVALVHSHTHVVSYHVVHANSSWQFRSSHH